MVTVYFVCWLCYMCTAFDLQGWEYVSNTATMERVMRWERIVLSRRVPVLYGMAVPRFPSCAYWSLSSFNPYPLDYPGMDVREWPDDAPR